MQTVFVTARRAVDRVMVICFDQSGMDSVAKRVGEFDELNGRQPDDVPRIVGAQRPACRCEHCDRLAVSPSSPNRCAHAAVEMASLSSPQEHRAVAARDLLRRLPEIAPRRIGNLRGGPEAAEDLLARRFPRAEIASIEFASDARDDASSSLGQYRFRLSCVGGWQRDEPFDLIFSNGTLDMLPSLRQLTAQLLSLTKQGGVLAFHLPKNLREPNRQLLRMVAAEGPWAKELIPVAKSRPFDVAIEDLDAFLRPLCRSIEFWQTTYFHRTDGAWDIIESMRETSLAPFLRPLNEEMRRQFLARYADELTQAYPAQPDGKVLLRFSRIFFLARR